MASLPRLDLVSYFHRPGTANPRLLSESAAAAAFKFVTAPGRVKTLSEKLMIVETRFVGSEVTGRLLRKFKSAGDRAAAATERAGKLLRLPS